MECPKCGGPLEKTMKKASKVWGFWYPGFRCTKCGTTYDYVEIMGEKAAALERERWEYAGLWYEQLRALIRAEIKEALDEYFARR